MTGWQEFLALTPEQDASPVSPDELEALFMQLGAERYHSLHPFHKLLHGGALDKTQVQAWALNRYYYQCSIPARHKLISIPSKATSQPASQTNRRASEFSSSIGLELLI